MLWILNVLQVYKGLSIATAKANSEERSQAPHHLLDITTPNEPFTVTHFRDLALPIVSIIPCLVLFPLLFRSRLTLILMNILET